MSEPVKRRYHSPVRQAQAARTREQILEAASRLFQEDGFGPTTVRRIAEAAGVVPETVYAIFGSKARLLTAIVDVRLAPEGQSSILERPEVAALAAEPDQRRLLHGFTQDYAAMSERVRPISEVLRTAKAVDPAMAGVRDAIEGHRHRYMRTIAGWLGDRGPLLVSVDRAADIIWALASPDVSRMLCDVRGWTTAEYAAWLAEALAVALVPAQTRRRKPGR